VPLRAAESFGNNKIKVAAVANLIAESINCATSTNLRQLMRDI